MDIKLLFFYLKGKHMRK